MAKSKPVTTIGRMCHRVTVQTPDGPAATQTTSGAITPDWQAVATLYASVEPLAGREYWMAAQVQADVTHRVVIRYRADVRTNGPRWRLLHRGRVLSIITATDFEERERFVELLCREQV